MAIATAFTKKIAAVALAALTIGAGVTVQTGAAEARIGRGGAVALGVAGALLTGALIAGSANAQNRGGYYDDGGYDYAPPAPVYQPRAVYQSEPVYYNAAPQYYGYPDHRRAPRHHYRNRHAGYSETGFAYRGPSCKLKYDQVWNGYGYELRQVQVCR